MWLSEVQLKNDFLRRLAQELVPAFYKNLSDIKDIKAYFTDQDYDRVTLVCQVSFDDGEIATGKTDGSVIELMELLQEILGISYVS